MVKWECEVYNVDQLRTTGCWYISYCPQSYLFTTRNLYKVRGSFLLYMKFAHKSNFCNLYEAICLYWYRVISETMKPNRRDLKALNKAAGPVQRSRAQRPRITPRARLPPRTNDPARENDRAWTTAPARGPRRDWPGRPRSTCRRGNGTGRDRRSRKRWHRDCTIGHMG